LLLVWWYRSGLEDVETNKDQRRNGDNAFLMDIG
jgi:hypothetical protein